MSQLTQLDTFSGELSLIFPDHDVNNPELTILIPAMNEGLTIKPFLEWCHEGMVTSSTVAEILIIDSSTDETAAIALKAGARVLRTPPRGLGQAYKDALPYIRGKYVVMGDADCTYDFRQLGLFLEQMRGGFDFVMGSRFRGVIEKDAMPKLHRYFGTPLTTFFLNFMFGSNFTDIHCGMRGITRQALVSMQLQSRSWEYASEMVLKSVHMGLSTTEVPINFYKDREGRLSHMKRGGWLEPWRAGWKNLRAMFVYGADFFLVRPGQIMLGIGLALVVPLIFGPLRAGPVELSLNWMLLGTTVSTVGLGFCYTGAIFRLLFDYTLRQRQMLDRWFPYDRTILIVSFLLLSGLFLTLPLVWVYVNSGLRIAPDATHIMHLAVFGLWLIITSVQTFTFLLLKMAVPLKIVPLYKEQ